MTFSESLVLRLLTREGIVTVNKPDTFADDNASGGSRTPGAFGQLAAKWYQYVTTNHHKDRDCHFYVEVDYAYGEPPVYEVAHYGYIGGDWREKIPSIGYAESALLRNLRRMIAGQKRWVDDVLAARSEYDHEQVAQAELWYSLFQESDHNHEALLSNKGVEV